MQTLRVPSMVAAISIAMSRCRALGKDKHPFNKGVPPEWWPEGAPFVDLSKQKRSALQLLVLQLLGLPQEHCTAIADELCRQGYRYFPFPTITC